MITVTASNARISDCIGGGRDVDVRIITEDGAVLAGEVTLVLNGDTRSRREWVASGSLPDAWISGGLLKSLREVLASLPDHEWRETLDTIEHIASDVAGSIS